MIRKAMLPTLIVAILTAAAAREPAGSGLHFALSKSVPADSSAVRAASEIRLWFTEVPEDGTLSIRLLTATGDAVHTGEVAQDEQEPTAFSVELHGVLAPGPYTVAWRAVGGDGHVARGTLTFTVTSVPRTRP